MPDKPFSRIDLTPLVGVQLALFATLAVVGLGTPPATTDKLHTTVEDPPIGNRPRIPDRFVVHVRRDGAVTVNGREVPLQSVASEFRRIPVAKRPSTVWVEADMEAEYAMVFSTYRAIESQGLGADIGIINERVAAPQ